MNVAYICSPYRGEVKRNKEYAREVTKKALMNGYSPITPHLYLTEVLDDEVEHERELALDTDLDLLERCDTIIVGARYGRTEGMKREIERAITLKLEIIIWDEVTPQEEFRKYLTERKNGCYLGSQYGIIESSICEKYLDLLDKYFKEDR